MIVFHFPPLTYKGQKGATGKNVHSISQTPPHETLKCVKGSFLFPPYDLCGDLGDPGPPGEIIHKDMHYILTL